MTRPLLSYFPIFVLFRKLITVWHGVNLPVFLLLFASLEAISQEDAVGRLPVVFSGMGWGEPVRDVYYQSAGEERELRLPANRRSSFLVYNGSDPLIFYRKQTNEKGKVDHIPAGRAELGAGGGTPFLIFVGDVKRRGDAYRVLVLGEDLTDADGTTVRFANFTTEQVAVRIDGQELVLPATAIETLDIDLAAGATVKPVMIALYHQKVWELAFSTRWELRPGNRRTIFIFYDENGDIQVTYLNENTSALHRLVERTRGRM